MTEYFVTVYFDSFEKANEFANSNIPDATFISEVDEVR